MRIDLHVHTLHSEDGINCPDLIMRIARRRGLDGIAITDHNTTKGWKSAKEAAKRHGMLFVQGEEIKVTQDGKRAGEILALFLNEEIPRADAWEVIDKVREQEGVVVIAHPFDHKKGFSNLRSFLGRIDAIECYNSRLPSRLLNERALKFAHRTRIGMTGGSDAHAPWEVGKAFTTAHASDLEEFRNAMLKYESRCGGVMEPVLPHMLSIFSSIPRKIGHEFEK